MKPESRKKTIEEAKEDSKKADAESKKDESASAEENEVVSCSLDESDDFLSFSDDSFLTSETESDVSSILDGKQAWDDSDDIETNEDVLNLKDGDVKKRIKRTEPDRVDLKNSVFAARCKIKMLKVFEEVAIIVDTFNLVYVLDKSMKEHKTYKFKFFRISDLELVGETVYFASDSSAVLYTLNIKTGAVECLRKGVGCITRILYSHNSKKMYLLGSSLTQVSSNLIVENTFHEQFVSLTLFNDYVVGMKEDRTLLVLDGNLQFLSQLSLDSKFTFTGLFSDSHHLFIATETGVIAIDCDLKVVKELTNTKTEPTLFAYTPKYVMYASQMHQQFRILNASTFVPLDTFSHKSLGFKSVSGLGARTNRIFIATGKDILEYEIDE
ncbi:hypothetical protein ECANGB1_1005 [Enterospora canceri]|uniref:Uncharacterized protein n=1 Tax=Enterospora canceri TaxID=1081671 RepID=A0A1Y1S7S0_9MICR|nr:hypothetical protein ECANGB1_1005 [Enterospora canceri]